MEFTDNLGKAMESLHKRGAFLTSSKDGKNNTMVISWGNIGFEWGKPIFTVLVRQSRYTKEFIDGSGEFTVSIPFNDDMKKALSYCGSKSGRDVDKYKDCKLEVSPSKEVSAPIIKCQGIFYECKVCYSQKMDLNLLSDELKVACYKDNDEHTIYYGEIVQCYCI